MEEPLHHLTCTKPCHQWHIYNINWWFFPDFWTINVVSHEFASASRVFEKQMIIERLIPVNSTKIPRILWLIENGSFPSGSLPTLTLAAGSSPWFKVGWTWMVLVKMILGGLSWVEESQNLRNWQKSNSTQFFFGVLRWFVGGLVMFPPFFVWLLLLDTKNVLEKKKVWKNQSNMLGKKTIIHEVGLIIHEVGWSSFYQKQQLQLLLENFWESNDFIVLFLKADETFLGGV